MKAKTQFHDKPELNRQNSVNEIGINAAIYLCHEEFFELSKNLQIIAKFICQIFAEGLIGEEHLIRILQTKLNLRSLARYILLIFGNHKASCFRFLEESKMNCGKHWNNIERSLLISQYISSIKTCNMTPIIPGRTYNSCICELNRILRKIDTFNFSINKDEFNAEIKIKARDCNKNDSENNQNDQIQENFPNDIDSIRFFYISPQKKELLNVKTQRIEPQKEQQL